MVGMTGLGNELTVWCSLLGVGLLVGCASGAADGRGTADHQANATAGDFVAASPQVASEALLPGAVGGDPALRTHLQGPQAAESPDPVMEASQDGLQAGPPRLAAAADGVGRCDAGSEDREYSSYDTSGDGLPNVRKVFLRVGHGDLARRILICRQIDLNGDGRADVTRYYDDEGAVLQEDADRDFDGRVDLSIDFQDGRMVQWEFDRDRNGWTDGRVFYAHGQPQRAEHDRSRAGW